MQRTALDDANIVTWPTRAAAARDAALEALASVQVEPTSLVEYQSHGRLLVIGPHQAAVAAAVALHPRLACTVVTSARDAALPHGVVAVQGLPVSLTGHLGDYHLKLAGPDGPLDLGVITGSGPVGFDLVLDLGTRALLDRELPPLGYFPVGNDPTALASAMEEIPELIGTFEKPTFFRYDPDICAHGARGLTGCTRCLDTCPTGAITALAQTIEVDPYLCQGAGSCAAACPTGAITYAYPRPSDLLTGLRRMLKVYREAGGRTPCLLFHDAESGLARVERLLDRLPAWVLPVALNEIGSAGMDLWLAALAYGASRCVLLGTSEAPDSVANALQAQLGVARAILQGMGHDVERLQWLSGDDDALLRTLAAAPPSALPPASFATFDEKRATVRMAVEHLWQHAPAAREWAPLPADAPFGEVRVDREACTLCLGCVAVCPPRALTAGNGVPQLVLNESACVQCGLCKTACPENAVSLIPRYVYDPQLRRATRVLNEEPPFLCVACGKPFATRSVIDKMTDKLKGHRMFQSAAALRRLQMCEDCRVRDLLEEGADPALMAHPGRDA